MSTNTEKNGFLDGITASVGGIEVIQDGDSIGVARDIEQSSADDDMGSPVAESIRTQREQLTGSNHETLFDLYDAMVDMDPELSGATHAISQSASQYEIVAPVDEPSKKGQKAVEDCKQMHNNINGEIMAIDVLLNLIKHGNDMSKKVYDSDQGIKAIQSLPVNAMTIVDDEGDIRDSSSDSAVNSWTRRIGQAFEGNKEEIDEEEELDEVFSRELYVLNEADNNRRIKPHKILHFSIDSRSNWFTDRMGRETYGVWGRSRLEPLKFTIQTKYNTLTNKVAMDDKLLAREIYYIDTKELFGDITSFEERRKKAQEYAKNIKKKLEGLGPDERPILPDSVEIEVIGPEGKAIDQTPFLEQLNNSIAAALTFPMAGLGRGTTSVKAGEEISSLWAENNIRNLRQVLIKGYEELHRDHLKLLHPEWMVEPDADPLKGRLKPEVEVPTLEYEPFKEEDMLKKARQVKLLYQTETSSTAERREIMGQSTDDESIETVREEFGSASGGNNTSDGNFANDSLNRSSEESQGPSGDEDETSDDGEDGEDQE